MSITIDKAGRLVLPKDIREQLGLSAGDELELSVGEDSVTLRPKANASSLKRINGRWVWATGTPMEPDFLLKQLEKSRTDRMKHIAGLK
jgi:AbrB family looped-hinge helix DNA binding protein